MSHYSVLVINTAGEDNIEEQLAPHNENIETEKYIQYTKKELIKKGKEEIESFKNGPYKEYLKDKKKYKSGATNKSHINYLEKGFPKKLKFTEEEIYQDQLQGFEGSDIGENGEVYSTYNPKSKWDYYEVGGRFAGQLKIKSKDDFVDQAYFEDIDWDGMKSKKEFVNACKFWDLYVDKKPVKTEADKELIKFVLYKPEYYKNRYKDKLTYAECLIRFSTYAVLKDGEWFAPGDMSWWGMSSEEDAEALDWELNYFDKFLKDLPKKALLTIVDCHI